MNYNTHDELTQAWEKMARLHKIDAMLDKLRSDHRQLEYQKTQLGRQLAKESADVRKLEGKSLATIFYSVLGKLDEKLDKEKAEELAARLQYEQVCKELVDVQEEIQRLESERVAYEGCEQEFNLLYERKREELMQRDDPVARRLFNLTDEARRLKSKLKEIEEAVMAGEDALYSLGEIKNSLNSAHGWGTFDLLGGGFIADLAKHSHIDDAKRKMEDAQRKLRIFSAELADIEMGTDFIMSTQGFAKFADFFFDGLIADWYMQSKINNALDSVTNVENQVNDVMERLRQIKEQGEYELEKHEKAIEKLVLEA